MSDAKTFAADLLTARRGTIHASEPVRGPGTGQSPDAVFAEVRKSLDELEALRAKEPAKALEAFQKLLDDPTLTDRDLTSYIDVWRTAIDSPEEFDRQVRKPPDRGVADWWGRIRAFLHRPAEPTANDLQKLEALGALYVLPKHDLAPELNPNERMLETADPAWAPLLGAKLQESKWPDGLIDMPRHDPAHPYVYPAIDETGAPLPKGRAIDIGLMSDFGTGYYHSWGIAEQLAAWAFPYAFHLGDVYYAGRKDEFTRRFEQPLFDVVRNTRLLGLAENHELYCGGGFYLEYFRKLRARGRTPQEGSYFCVRFPDHQIIGIDVNWQGRQQYRDPELVAWLRARLDEAEGRTNILLSGSAPFDYGAAAPRPLLGELWPFVSDGSVPLWLWGDDHYCALFERNENVPFYGCCIGHGGYPGAVQPDSLGSWDTRPVWWESEPRFPKWTGLRQDMTNNGWCHATLQPGGGVDLTFVDWMWSKRASISFAKVDGKLRRGEPTTFEREEKPVVHRPR
jgi:hypothetical protein